MKETRQPSLGLQILGLLFAFGGLRAFARLDEVPSEEMGLRILSAALAIVTICVGVGLFSVRSWTLRAYTAWAGIAVASIATREYVVEHEPWPGVLVLLVLAGAVYAAVGFYLKGVLSRATPSG